MSKTYRLISLVLLGAMFATLLILLQKPWQADASTVLGNDYSATSTKNYLGVALPNFTVLRFKAGALARVTITGANTGVVRLWDATTTDVNLRASSMASSTLLSVDIPASAVANTYDFDAEFKNGILYELVSGIAPTSTIAWR